MGGEGMIYDILEVFRREYDEKGDKLILDNYQLKDGLYLRIDDINQSCEVFVKSSKKVKKEGQNETEHYFKNKLGELKNQEYDWFRQRDYFSNAIDTSKAFDAPKKTIHNNNYLTLFMKIEEFLNLEFTHLENKLYKKVLSFKEFNSKNEKKILEPFCHSIQLLSRKKMIVKKMRWIESNLGICKDIASEYNPKEYIRIYFAENEEIYKKESAVYLALKIYNNNKYSIEVNDLIYGLSNDNMGLNGKKPFLEQKTKKTTTPFMITPEVAMQSKLFFDWLGLQYYRTDLFDNMFLKKHSDNGKAIINDFDYLPLKIEKFDSSIQIKNYLLVKNKEDYEIKELFVLENTVDEIFYNKQLKHNYFRDDLKVSDFVSKKLQQLIFETKYAMVNYFKKFDEREFYQVVKKYGTDFATEHLRQNRDYKAKESLNLKFSLLQHKGEKVMDIKSMQEKMIRKLETSNYDSLESEEFFYLSGQVAKYLMSQSEAFSKNADMLEPFLRANNAQKLKKSIDADFFKYKHKIQLNHYRFNNAIALIMAYEGDDKLSYFMDNFLVGVLSQNLFYMKKEEN